LVEHHIDHIHIPYQTWLNMVKKTYFGGVSPHKAMGPMGPTWAFGPSFGTCSVPLPQRPRRLRITEALQDQKASSSSTLALANSMKESSDLQPPNS
jgi:hypothetical protein